MAAQVRPARKVILPADHRVGEGSDFAPKRMAKFSKASFRSVVSSLGEAHHLPDRLQGGPRRGSIPHYLYLTAMPMTGLLPDFLEPRDRPRLR